MTKKLSATEPNYDKPYLEWTNEQLLKEAHCLHRMIMVEQCYGTSDCANQAGICTEIANRGLFFDPEPQLED